MRRHEDTTRPTLLKCRLRAECHALCSLPSENNSLIGKWAVKPKHSFEGWMQGSHAPHTWVLRRKIYVRKGDQMTNAYRTVGFLPCIPRAERTLRVEHAVRLHKRHRPLSSK